MHIHPYVPDDSVRFYRTKTSELGLSDGLCTVCGCPGYRDNRGGFTFQNNVRVLSNSKIPKSSSHNRCKKSNSNISTFQFLVNLLATSSISGISNCASSRTGLRTLLWLIVFVGCFVGYLYQTLHFYNFYQHNPTVVQIQVENDGQVEFPAVTICNANSTTLVPVSGTLRKSEFCKYFSNKCEDDKQNITITEVEMKKMVYELLINKNGSIKKDLGHSQDMIESCIFHGYPSVPEEECLKILGSFYDPDFGNCYTIPAKNIDGLPLEAREGDFWQETNDMSVLINVEPEENMEPERQAGVYLVVHDESTQPDIMTDGLFLTPGLSYSIGVRKSTVLLLPLPYKMNCTDYFKLPWQKMYRRRLTSRMCTVGCSQYFQQRECGYVTENLSLFYDELPYEKIDVTDDSRKCAGTTEERTLGYCRSICGLPCRDTVFSTRTESTPLTRKLLSRYHLYHKPKGNSTYKQAIIHVRVFYATFEHKIYKHTPKYDTLEIFSFMGGYSGVWLGFSLLTVYEILEIAATTICFAVQKCRKHRHNRKVIRAVLGSRGNAKPAARTNKRKRYYR